MTISTQSSSIIVAANGIQQAFQFPFIGDTAADITVTSIASNGIYTALTTGYTVTLNAPVANQLWGVGGNVSFNTAPASGTQILIQRLLSLTQQTSIQNQGNYYSQVVEQAMDTLEMQIQQVSARTGQLRGVWASGVFYNYGDVVIDGANGANTGNYYMCIIANTSGTWATDLSNGYWAIAINVQLIQGYSTSAAASASTATSEAAIATTQAGIATTEAGIATTQATNAASSASSASSSASSASSSASTATTQATNASTSATNAASSASSASSSASSASSSASTATTQATNASTSATNAASSATSAAASAVLAGSTLTATSTTSNTIGTGSFTFTVQANKNFFAGQYIIAASNANSSNFIHGQVSSYSGTTLIMTETDNGGSGTHTDWNISVSGTQGTAGSGSGSVTSITFTGDGTVLSSTPSSAVTTSGTVTGTLNNAGAGTVLGNTSSSSAAPIYTSTPQLGKSGTLGSLTMGNATSGLLTLEPVAGALGTVTISVPAATDTLSVLGTAQTFSALKTFSGGIYQSAGAAEEAAYSNGNSGTSKAVNLDNGNLQSVTITGAVAITQTTPTHPGKYTLVITQDGTGHVYSLSGIKWPGGSAPTYSSAASKIDVISIVYDGSNYYGMGGIAFS